jgi:hypothetical protein
MADDPKQGDVCLFPECPSGARHVSLRETLVDMQRVQRESHEELKNGQAKIFDILSNQKMVLSTLVQHGKDIDEMKAHRELIHGKLFDQIRAIEKEAREFASKTEKEAREFVTKDDVTKIIGIFTGIVTLVFIGLEVLFKVIWKSGG